MLQLKAQPFIEALDLLTQLVLGSRDERVGPFDKESLEHVQEKLEALEGNLIDLELPLSCMSLRELKGRLSTVTPLPHCEFLLNELRSRIRDEIAMTLLLKVPAAKATYYKAIEPFGTEVASRFPSIAYDAVEAFRSFALNRSTACVFHLMRVLEIGLRVFAARFDVPADHTNWHNIIEGIEKAVRNMGSDPARAAGWQECQEFYSQAASYFMVVKDAWRNYTAHARGKYTEEEAEIILINVRAFMQRLATHLHE